MSAEPQFPGNEREVKRRHLSVVPRGDDRRVPEKSSRSQKALVPDATPRTRWTMLIFVIASIPLTLMLILLTNILTASRQYDLVDLRTQELSLSQQNEALSQEIAYYQAPQDLAVRASQLGLIATQAQATINLQTGEITGTPVPAAPLAEDDQSKTENLIDPPALYDTQAYATASQRAEEQKKKDEEAAKAKAEEEKKAEETRRAEEAKKSASASPSPSSSGH
ncbi:hypothetical protein [uncultured Rothia sp.]|uniref:hypothetical protein n=1 Tax=uncultured Rothia sp. TaxID=316088 RepID=UPI003216B5BB